MLPKVLIETRQSNARKRDTDEDNKKKNLSTFLQPQKSTQTCLTFCERKEFHTKMKK
jgi:hypothetical protein